MSRDNIEILEAIESVIPKSVAKRDVSEEIPQFYVDKLPDHIKYNEVEYYHYIGLLYNQLVSTYPITSTTTLVNTKVDLFRLQSNRFVEHLPLPVKLQEPISTSIAYDEIIYQLDRHAYAGKQTTDYERKRGFYHRDYTEILSGYDPEFDRFVFAIRFDALV